MIQIRPSHERGRNRIDWLDSHHSFSFGEYHDPAHMGFASLRVINEDVIAPAMGFGLHPHRDMEIVTYIVDGALEHKDSLGNGSVIRRGDVQRMTAGTGILHSEFNPSESEPVHLLQIWILPEFRGLKPGYEEKKIPDDQKRKRMKLIASRDGRDGSLTIHQDAELYASILDKDRRIDHPLRPGRKAWLQVVRGNITLNGKQLSDGDGAALVDEREVAILASAPTELLLFDLA